MNIATTIPFNWSLIRSFLAALDQGSLLGAARQLKTSQPTLGRHIAELESQLGVVLFERTGRGLVPTATALQLAEAAREMEAGAIQLTRTLSGAQMQTTGTVRITASVPVAVQLLPPILARMRQSLPDIQVELVSSNQVSNLLRREADIAVRMVRPEQGTLVAKKIGSVGVGAYAHRTYLARRSPIRQATDLLQHDLIGSDADPSILRGFHAMGYAVGPEAFALRTDDFIAQWQAVRAGLGIGFIADYMARTDTDVLPVLKTVLKIPDLPMWLAVHREIRTSGRIRAVYDFLAEALPQAIAAD
ncbi:MAG TPA: LysR family transcriptional regulator [Rhodoferax sp.]|jgi:DNA-binding transcriptional LysR family regulator|nr:LysR family transcriptional regulator [Rhodoferax sp.]HNV59899.1 LysR family transcriptional regulator [Rhodoferax sp.]HPW29287.1 LysR family transcriptional regulator [Rhodoferax sp.]